MLDTSAPHLFRCTKMNAVKVLFLLIAIPFVPCDGNNELDDLAEAVASEFKKKQVGFLLLCKQISHLCDFPLCENAMCGMLQVL